MNSAGQPPGSEPNCEMVEFLNSAVHNLAKFFEQDSEYDPEEIKAVVNKLPQVLREMAPFLARREAEDWPADSHLLEL